MSGVGAVLAIMGAGIVFGFGFGIGFLAVCKIWPARLCAVRVIEEERK